MEKKVRVTVSGLPIVTTSVPLLAGTHGPLVLDEKDIFKCIIAGAKVVEVFDNGFEKVLTLSNYEDKPQSRYFSDTKPEKVHLKPSEEEVKEVLADIAKEVSEAVVEPNTEESDLNSTVATDETPVEEKVEEQSAEVETKSPEHWTPPQRYSNNNNNRNNGNNRNNNNGKK